MDNRFTPEDDVLTAENVRFAADFVAGVGFDVFSFHLFGRHCGWWGAEELVELSGLEDGSWCWGDATMRGDRDWQSWCITALGKPTAG